MKKTPGPWDVSQGSLFPPAPKDLLPEDHLSHFIRDLVRDELDLSAIHAHYAELRGHPPYHPAMMTALLLYGYCRGVFSSRKREQAREERVDFMALTGAGPSPTTARSASSAAITSWRSPSGGGRGAPGDRGGGCHEQAERRRRTGGLVEQIKGSTGTYPAQVSADAGDCSEANIVALEERKVDPYIATGRQLTARQVRPTRGTRCRATDASEAGEAQGRWLRESLPSSEQVVEPVFGQIKRARGFRQFLHRGLAKVEGEWSLVCTSHNLLNCAAPRIMPRGTEGLPGITTGSSTGPQDGLRTIRNQVAIGDPARIVEPGEQVVASRFMPAARRRGASARLKANGDGLLARARPRPRSPSGRGRLTPRGVAVCTAGGAAGLRTPPADSL